MCIISSNNLITLFLQFQLMCNCECTFLWNTCSFRCCFLRFKDILTTCFCLCTRVRTSYLTDTLCLFSYVCHTHINSIDLSTNHSQHLCFLANASFWHMDLLYLSPCVFFSNGPWGQTATLPVAPRWQSQIRKICGLTLAHAVSEQVPGIAWPVIMVRKPHWDAVSTVLLFTLPTQKPLASTSGKTDDPPIHQRRLGFKQSTTFIRGRCLKTKY